MGSELGFWGQAVGATARWVCSPITVLLLIVVCGCAPQPNQPIQGHVQGQRLAQYLRQLPTVESVEHWSKPEFLQDPCSVGLNIVTEHYLIHTTVTDPLILRQLPMFMESAFRSYSRVSGSSTKTDKKLVMYFFGSREEWETFSKHWTRNLAPVYLKIRAGAYYYNGACVAYHIGRHSNLSVLAHEGWHQFSDELFKHRLCAWLDEGLATNFESYSWEKGRVAFATNRNASRLFALKESLARGEFFAISELLSLDAGRVISHTKLSSASSKADSKVVAYYAQLYALVRFLREHDYGQYLQDFNRMVDDARDGRWPLEGELLRQAEQRETAPTRRWNAAVGQTVFGHYITPNSEQLEEDYRAFCQKIVSRARFKKRL